VDDDVGGRLFLGVKDGEVQNQGKGNNEESHRTGVSL
jgi:hypothetical protein